MKKFDPNYELLADMYGDSYYPTFLVDKIKFQLQEVIKVLEQGETNVNTIQNQLDQAVLAIKIVAKNHWACPVDESHKLFIYG